jgi:hypothetical protein
MTNEPDDNFFTDADRAESIDYSHLLTDYFPEQQQLLKSQNRLARIESPVARQLTASIGTPKDTLMPFRLSLKIPVSRM